MTIQLLVDMNLSPQWVDVFESNQWQAVHWSKVGDPQATDEVVMDWARANRYVVFTHDLDFGTLLALTHAEGAERHPNSCSGCAPRSSEQYRHRCPATARDFA